MLSGKQPEPYNLGVSLLPWKGRGDYCKAIKFEKTMIHPGYGSAGPAYETLAKVYLSLSQNLSGSLATAENEAGETV